ncbi:DUF523 domain-containing protein [Candidatus Omnitrophota bacterium]
MKPKVFVSKCLGLSACRWDGGIAPDPFIEKLKPRVDFIGICPECEIGLGVPREPLRIIFKRNFYRLIQLNTGKDLTASILKFTSKFLKTHKKIDAFILKSRSPSCGIKNVKAYANLKASRPIEKTSGFFAKEILKQLPDMAVETEETLANLRRRKKFIAKLFATDNKRKNSKKRRKK